MSGRVLSVLALAGFAACNTYNDSLLQGSLGSSIPAAGAVGIGGNAGEGTGATAGEDATADAGAAGETANGGSGAGASVGGEGNGGSPVAEAGNSGNPALGGSSGASGGAGSPGMSGAGAGGAPIVPLIDDFEDLNEFVNRVNGRNGPWYVFSDGTKAGTLGPLTITAFPPADANSSSAGLHLTASGFTVWGAGVGADMVNQAGKKVAYDVSAYSGIRFSAKIAAGSTAVVNVLVPNIHSDVDGGDCTDTVATKHCGDHLFKSVTGLKTTWAVYEVKFADLTVQGFGNPQTTFDSTGVYSVQFTQTNKLPIDIWFDDVSFVLK